MKRVGTIAREDRERREARALRVLQHPFTTEDGLTDFEATIVNLAAHGWKAREIAHSFGQKQTRVQGALNRARVKLKMGRWDWTLAMIQRVEAEFKKGTRA